jgi:hypothetical protein
MLSIKIARIPGTDSNSIVFAYFITCLFFRFGSSRIVSKYPDNSWWIGWSEFS